MPRPLKSTAKLWPQSKGPNTKYRDRQRITLPDGTKRDLAGYGPTKQAATEDLCHKAEGLERAHAPASPETITVTALFAEFVQHKRSVKGNKAKTTFNDLKDYRLHIGPAIGDKMVGEVVLGELVAIQHGLVSGGKYRTAELVTISLKSFWSYAAKRYRDIGLPNIAADLDAIKRPRTVKPKAELWTLPQLQAFLEAAKARYDASRRSLMYPLFYAAISAGLRRGELLGLRWEHVRRNEYGAIIQVREQYVPDNGVLYLETPKTGASARDLPITEELYLILMAHRELLLDLERRLPDYAQNDLVFPSLAGGVVSPSNLRRSYNALIKRAELPPIYFHSLRKCAATYITQALVDAGRYAPKIVAQILGHARPDVALQIYTKVIDNDLRYATFNPLVTGRLQSQKKSGASEETPSLIGSDEET